MKTYLDCVPCFIRQAFDAVSFVTDDEAVREKVLREVLVAVAEMDYKQSPPLMGQVIHRLIRKHTGNDDPYKDIKIRYNRYALNLYERLKGKIESSDDSLQTAVRLAIAGNIIDFGAKRDLDISAVYRAIDHALKTDLDQDTLEKMRRKIDQAGKIMYIGDNSGEIVFDRLLIEILPREKITFVVRGYPVLNDAVMEDARMTGMTELVDVIDNGSDAPGMILDDCSEHCREIMQNADLIIAKGQGNFETLFGFDKEIFFLFKAKCPVVAGHVGVEEGDIVIYRNVEG
ncbi:MAG: hypothetical protein DRP46_02595 [Candidatus Zixiibacteriota bacterium]|nr:MAG: hypothetical protein DRP46_02595 [candidate division Zixibacteria bacterium]HDL04057.1 DUF89 family protein [candidate division Zixibacteria bacterium]